MVISEKTTVSNGQGFETWLLTEKGLSEKWARNVEWYVKGLLVRENPPFPTKNDAETLALRVLKSDSIKSYKRNTLKALEHYMEYVGEPVRFKKERSLTTR